jgi:hypothetical protein
MEGQLCAYQHIELHLEQLNRFEFKIDHYCEENNLKIGGYYQANRHVDDKKYG